MATRNACHVSLGMREPRCFPDRYKSGSCGPRPFAGAAIRRNRPGTSGQSRQLRRKPEGERCSRA
jgi:hypothetical protein